MYCLLFYVEKERNRARYMPWNCEHESGKAVSVLRNEVDEIYAMDYEEYRIL